jgi:flagellar biogenesis protein FliO
MYSFLSNLRSAGFVSATVLAGAFCTAEASAQTAQPPMSKPAPLLSWSVGDEQPSLPPRPSARTDREVQPAAFAEGKSEPLIRQPNGQNRAKQAAPAAAVTTNATGASDPRRLAPPSGPSALLEGKLSSDSNSLPFSLPRIESFTTAGAGLAIVVGLFLMCVWLMRRGGPKPSSPLPKEAVAVLGRVPLAGSHFAHLLQLGNKLVLVSVGPDSVTSLAEVTDPNEVNRLLGLCTRKHKNSTTAEFHQVLEELAKEPTQGFLGKQASRGRARTVRS